MFDGLEQARRSTEQANGRNDKLRIIGWYRGANVLFTLARPGISDGAAKPPEASRP
jgi:hypothetical protein